jgi:hypothetical protein
LVQHDFSPDLLLLHDSQNQEDISAALSAGS